MVDDLSSVADLLAAALGVCAPVLMTLLAALNGDDVACVNVPIASGGDGLIVMVDDAPEFGIGDDSDDERGVPRKGDTAMPVSPMVRGNGAKIAPPRVETPLSRRGIGWIGTNNSFDGPAERALRGGEELISGTVAVDATVVAVDAAPSLAGDAFGVEIAVAVVDVGLDSTAVSDCSGAEIG